MVFNKKVPEKEYHEIRVRIQKHLGIYKHPKQLTTEDISWLKKNIKQFDKEVLNKIITDSILPDKPKEKISGGTKWKKQKE
jgi:hypothetical protein